MTVAKGLINGWPKNAMTTKITSELELTESLRQRIEATLQQYVEFDADCPTRLRDAIQYSLLAPGKRLRPQLVVMAAQACGGTISDALPAAAAVEMIHAYSLVHDDLPAMDDDDLRRGRPTCHKRFGEATAILVGDALLALAFEVLATKIRPAERAAHCCGVLAQAAGATALVGGQADDLDGQFSDLRSGQPALDQLESIHRRKTGALFRVSLRLGAIVSDASQEQCAALDAYGEQLGLAFQVVDDLLDVAGDESTVGKRVGKDDGRGKTTYPGMLGVAASQERAERLIDEACRSIESFGEAAAPLRKLARYVSKRNK